MNAFQELDYIVFFCYFIIVVGLALYVSRKPANRDRNAEDYFLAGRSLPWWIIGASLIASNISTEQIIGMNGTAFESGIAVVSYSLIGAVSILLVAKFFLPAFLKMKIFSMPEFLEKRYGAEVSSGMSVFWILVYVFVNLTSVLSLGAITLQAVLGIPILYSIIGLAVVSAVYTIYGGLAAVAWTDFIQVLVLVIGGIAVVWIGLDTVSMGKGLLVGLQDLIRQVPEKFHTILPASHSELPWTGVFLGGLWISGLSYWGCNQYIIQRALAAKNLKEAQNGLLFSAFLSLVVAVIIVLPGVIAFDLFGDQISSRDQAFPFLIKELLPVGCMGLVIASLVAAIISSLNSMCNSVATIFALDIYRKYLNRKASNNKLIIVGRITTAVALCIAAMISPTIAQIGRLFAFIQEYTGFITPGVFCVFMLGLFWKKANTNGALAAILLTVPVSVLFKFVTPEIAFLNRMALTFLILLLVQIIVSVMTPNKKNELCIEISIFKESTSLLFNVGTFFIIGFIALFYLIFK